MYKLFFILVIALSFCACANSGTSSIDNKMDDLQSQVNELRSTIESSSAALSSGAPSDSSSESSEIINDGVPKVELIAENVKYVDGHIEMTQTVINNYDKDILGFKAYFVSRDSSGKIVDVLPWGFATPLKAKGKFSDFDDQVAGYAEYTGELTFTSYIEEVVFSDYQRLEFEVPQEIIDYLD